MRGDDIDSDVSSIGRGRERERRILRFKRVPCASCCPT